MSDFETQVQRRAAAHLEACHAAMFDECDSPSYAPFDGCPECVVREVLEVTWEAMMREAEREYGIGDDNWFVPGGAVIDESRQVKLRLRPPASWHRVEIELARVPPSQNTNEIRSHWRGYQKEKKSWQTEIEQLLMVAKCRRGYLRALAGGIIRFPSKVSRRDSGNFAGLVNKALGDALVNYGAIPDDDTPHFYFGGVEIEDDTGPPQTRLVVYLQPKEEANAPDNVHARAGEEGPLGRHEGDQQGGHARRRRVALALHPHPRGVQAQGRGARRSGPDPGRQGERSQVTT